MNIKEELKKIGRVANEYKAVSTYSSDGWCAVLTQRQMEKIFTVICNVLAELDNRTSEQTVTVDEP